MLLLQPPWCRSRGRPRGGLLLSQASVLWLLPLLLQPAFQAEAVPGMVSAPGGAGHALLFQDHVVLKTDFRDFPSTELTFEAWISTSDFCHAGTVMSYAKNSQATDASQRIADFNHFVIFDTRALLACHDFQYIDLLPDPGNVSCHAAYSKAAGGSRKLPGLVERDGSWHHLAVTWSAANEGLTNIYVDGSLMATARSGKTAPLDPNGAFMLGGEQDCFGGCVDPSQGFHGLMDEVRLWRRALPQAEIATRMRWNTGFAGMPDLVAWWKFDEPGEDPGIFSHHTVARDSSGRGNDLSLETPPQPRNVEIQLPESRGTLHTGALEFRNGLALSKRMSGFPTKSFSVEMWAKGAKLESLDNLQQRSTQLLSYAAQKVNADGWAAPGFLDDAVRLERLHAAYLTRRSKYGGSTWVTNTAGAIALHVNSNEHTDDPGREAVVFFDAQWTDDNWHHIAVTWEYETGTAALYFDGSRRTAFYKSDYGFVEQKAAAEGGVTPRVAARTSRDGGGSLALGQDQDCLGGCFSAADAFKGQLAIVRLWDRPLGPYEVSAAMGAVLPPDSSRGGLVGLWSFGTEGLKTAEGGVRLALDLAGGAHPNHLQLRGTPPLFLYSDAPLSGPDGAVLPGPHPGAGGYSLALSDKQVLMLPNFRSFPSTSLTLEFWMWSTDRCRPGVPFSYAVGAYDNGDNAFLLFNYNSWGVSVMEDEGHLADHQSGVAATDGTWHHVAVSWDSASGAVRLYDNGRPVWAVTRGQGKVIPAGGTLVIGREQDCIGGCFDSAEGAAGNVSPVKDHEYGAQDFTGIIEEMRLWSVVRTAEDIRKGMDADDGRGPGGFDHPGVDPASPGLVAYWRFDEGAGYRVRDATGHGHDLVMLQEPNWVVTRWLSTCGNAVVEGVEECDDGDLSDGDGCSSTCHVEPGWTCTGNPSVCTRQSDQPKPGPPPPAPTPAPPAPAPGPAPPAPSAPPSAAPDAASHTDSAGGGGGGAAASGGGHRRRTGLVVGLVVAGAAVAVLVGVLAASWRSLPTGGRSLGSLQTRLVHRLPLPAALRARLAPEYSPLVVNPEELDLSPEFISASPPRAAPGHPGSYYPLGGGSSPGGGGWLAAPPTPMPAGRGGGGGGGPGVGDGSTV